MFFWPHPFISRNPIFYSLIEMKLVRYWYACNLLWMSVCPKITLKSNSCSYNVSIIYTFGNQLTCYATNLEPCINLMLPKVIDKGSYLINFLYQIIFQARYVSEKIRPQLHKSNLRSKLIQGWNFVLNNIKNVYWEDRLTRCTYLDKHLIY